jgi:hypothetical protein
MKRMEINNQITWRPNGNDSLIYKGIVVFTSGGSNGLALVEFEDPETGKVFKKWVPRKGTNLIRKIEKKAPSKRQGLPNFPCQEK